jgi:hypothetical protein
MAAIQLAWSWAQDEREPGDLLASPQSIDADELLKIVQDDVPRED